MERIKRGSDISAVIRFLVLALSFFYYNVFSLAADAAGLMVDYLQRYHQLAPRDVEGRLELAQWCAISGLPQQQANLLVEVLKLQPGHLTAYERLLAADATWNRPVDQPWADKLSNLLGPGYRLHHSRHFTLLTDADAGKAAASAQSLESLYQTYYRKMGQIGLSPMPPGGRLVCVFFSRVDAYRDFLNRFEAINIPWASGFYSWRTNRVAAFDDQDHPALEEARKQLEQLQSQIAQLRIEAEQLTKSGGSGLATVQARLRRVLPQENTLRQRMQTLTQHTTLDKLRHEVTHQLLANSGIQRRGRDCPFWLAEGLAMCFESADGPDAAGPTSVNPDRLRTYDGIRQANGLISLDELLAVRPNDSQAAAEVAGLYAQAWALVFFLWNQHPEPLRQYIATLSGDAPPANTIGLFRKCFGEDLATIQVDLRRMIDGQKRPGDR